MLRGGGCALWCRLWLYRRGCGDGKEFLCVRVAVATFSCYYFYQKAVWTGCVLHVVVVAATLSGTSLPTSSYPGCFPLSQARVVPQGGGLYHK